MKGKLILGVAAAVLFLTAGVFFLNPPQRRVTSDYPGYDSEASMVKAADLIVTGEVQEVRAEKIKILFSEEKTYRNDEDKELYTISKIKVTDVLKGNVSIGDVIEVKQMGDGKTLVDTTVKDSGGYFQKGEQKVLFLKSFAHYKVPYSVLNPIQAQYAVQDGRVRACNPSNRLFGSQSLAKGADSAGDTPEAFKQKVKSTMQ